ncbi:AEC family transporter [Pseudodesulfovibrio cashew]|uniref:AEC family transporter n=1 Tax=Pseudodesulfovibrio cashew TaxID=2678688 RepID=A0A6I6JDG4_9BACT|nr:AEC family transporter [Pseudodesulfovibrio cashew]QGY39048.1 AEC family transporter [Pseudodesulfovibrio cashew]
MSPVVLAIAPIFGLILLGFVLRRVEFPGVGFWPVSERLTYYVLFPALLISGLSGRSFDDSARGLAVVLFVSVCLVAGGLVALRKRLVPDGPQFTSVFQGSIRPNTYVGLSAAAALLGPDWMTLSAVALLTLIPLVNVLCVLILSRHGDNGGGVGRTFVELAKNPLILACVAGFLMNGLDIILPATLAELLTILGKAALPLGLLAVGAGLRFDGLGDKVMPVAVASAAHLLVLPLAAFLLSLFLGLDPLSRTAALIFTAIPVSVSAFILARQMGGDHRLMALVITTQTVLSSVTLPLILAVLG